MGDVVNEASKLCSKGNKEATRPVQVSASSDNNLNETYRGFLQMRFDLEPVGFRYGEGQRMESGSQSRRIRSGDSTLCRLLRRAVLFQPAPKPTLRGLFALPRSPGEYAEGLAGLFDPTNGRPDREGRHEFKAGGLFGR